MGRASHRDGLTEKILPSSPRRPCQVPFILTKVALSPHQSRRNEPPVSPQPEKMPNLCPLTGTPPSVVTPWVLRLYLEDLRIHREQPCFCVPFFYWEIHSFFFLICRCSHQCKEWATETMLGSSETRATTRAQLCSRQTDS